VCAVGAEFQVLGGKQLSGDLVDGADEGGLVVRRRRRTGGDHRLGKAYPQIGDDGNDLFAGFVADAAEVAKAGGRGGGKVADSVEVFPFEDVLGADGEIPEREWASPGWPRSSA
jgi:hypothetical protein